MSEHMEDKKKYITDCIDKGKSPQPYLELHEGDKMYKCAFVINPEPMEVEIEAMGKKKKIMAKWGLKVLSKEKPDGNIAFAFYYGHCDRNNDWWNKRGGGHSESIPKDKFQEFLDILGGFAESQKFIFDVQDYTILSTMEGQMAFGTKTNQMEVGKIELTKEQQKKLKEAKDGKGKTT